LLVNGELLGHLWTWLSGQEVLQLNVELLFLLNNHILFNNLFGFLDQSLLKSLNLLKHFPSIWVSTLKLSPSVVVQGVFKFLTESLDLESLSQ
jgi:hypothetical protein